MIETEKPVLDATCASRSIWFNKQNSLAIFVDRREMDNQVIWTSKDGEHSISMTIAPDVIADFTDLPFEDETFWHIIFDPPHLLRVGETSWLAKKYGRLEAGTWKQVLHDGFAECWRVLKTHGTLIFKWCDLDISANKIIEVVGHQPLYGCKSGKHLRTHWMAFIKETK